MTLSKTLGALLGAVTGTAIVGLYAVGLLKHTAAPATIVIASVLLGAFLGAALGAYIGSTDRRGN